MSGTVVKFKACELASSDSLVMGLICAFVTAEYGVGGTLEGRKETPCGVPACNAIARQLHETDP